MIRRIVEGHQLRRVSLRLQLTVLYTGVIGMFILAVLGVSGLLLRHSSTSISVSPSGGGPGVAPSTFNGGQFAIGASLVALVGLAVAVTIAWWVAGRFLRPFREINESAQEISTTDLHRRLDVSGPDDELTGLGRTLDGLFGKLESSFESQKRFVANASHELRTPLAGQRTLLQVALADPSPSVAGLRAACEEVLELGSRQERLVESLLTLASSEQGLEYPEVLDLAELAGKVVASRREAAAQAGVVLHLSLAAAPVSGDPDLLESLMGNLLDNAVAYNSPGGTVEVTTGRSGGASRLSVSNTGPVVPAAEVDRLFGAFQRLGTDRTSRSSGHGLGLGLAIVKAIADAHGAGVAAIPRAVGGLDVVVSFPDAASH